MLLDYYQVEESCCAIFYDLTLLFYVRVGKSREARTKKKKDKRRKCLMRWLYYMEIVEIYLNLLQNSSKRTEFGEKRVTRNCIYHRDERASGNFY